MSDSSTQQYIQDLDMNGMRGRMVRMPAPAGKHVEILFLYGQHSSMERWWGLLQYLNRYGAVTAPDLPGFGGMDSFYTIGKKPTIDNLADYVAAFIKLRYKRKKVIVLGMSLGFVVATRMLQRNPEMSKYVSMLVSLAGFTHYQDFSFSRARLRYYRTIGWVFSHRVPAWAFRRLLLNSFVLRRTYAHTFQARAKFAAARDDEERQRFMDAEVDLWHCNDPRTHAWTLYELLTLNNCTKRVELPVWHVHVKHDQYLNDHLVEERLRVVFPSVQSATSSLRAHAPSIIASAREAAPLIPLKVRRELRRLSAGA